MVIIVTLSILSNLYETKIVLQGVNKAFLKTFVGEEKNIKMTWGGKKKDVLEKGNIHTEGCARKEVYFQGVNALVTKSQSSAWKNKNFCIDKMKERADSNMPRISQ